MNNSAEEIYIKKTMKIYNKKDFGTERREEKTQKNILFFLGL